MKFARPNFKALARRLCGRNPLTALAAAGVAGLAVAAVCVRLSFGPMPADWLAPLLERGLARQVEGGRADIGKVGLVWFDDAGALGLQLENVRLTDGKRRPVLLARRVQAAVALDSLFAFTTAPGRIAAQDFFAAVSVSPRGNYELGYDADGAPGVVTGLDRLFADMTGRARMGRPMSFLRQLDLENGRLALRQVGGGVNWVAEVREVEFQKTDGRLTARADLEIRDRVQGTAGLQAQAQGSVGLKDAFVRAELRDLTPARVFPSVGPTRSLSALDAVVRGRGSLAYGAETGVRAADAAFSAGKGALRFGTTRQGFESAQVVAGYDPRTRDVEIQTLQLAAERTRLDLAGRLRLVPEDRAKHAPARLEFDVHGPRVQGALAADAPPQELTDVAAQGRYTPELRRIEIAHGRARVAGAPLTAKGVLFQNKRGAWGADLTARLEGAVGRDQVFAFWPTHLGGGARTWLAKAVLDGRYSNAVLTLKAPAGAFDRKVLRDQELKLTFDFQNAALRFMDGLPAVSAGQGSAVLQGNRFDLAMTGGRLDTIALSEGTVEIPRLKGDGARVDIRARGKGDAQAMLRVVDGTESRLLTSHGFAPERLTGAADVLFELGRPLGRKVEFKDYDIRYAGVVRGASVSRAALGWDLQDGEMAVDGDTRGVDVKGTGEVGPYRGRIEFASVFSRDGAETVDLDGAVRAATFGGRTDRTVALTGRFRTRGGHGEGSFRSAAGDGRVEWSKQAGGERFTLQGQADAPGLRDAGAPFVDGLPDHFPVEVTLGSTGATWTGVVEADALSGDLAYTPGTRPHLLYRAQVTPLEARRLGFGRLPLFEETRPVVVDAAWSGGDGAAEVTAGGLELAMSWTRAADGAVERRLRSALSPADLDALGLPNMLRPGTTLPVSLAWRTTPEGMAGTADFAGTPARFQAGPLRAGARQFVVWTTLDPQALRRWGAPDLVDFDGEAPVSVRWTQVEDQPLTGRLDLDLTAAYVGVPRSEWRKPAGQPARLAVSFLRESDGDLRLSRVTGEGEDFELSGSAAMTADGRLVSLDLTKAKLDGLIDGALRLWREPTGSVLNVRVDGRWLDARRLFDRLSAPASGGAGEGRSASVKFDAAVAGLRLTDDAVLRDVRASGQWGEAAVRRMELAARTGGGARLSGRLFPLAGVTGLSFETDDAGDLAKTLFDVESLRGGSASVTGRLVAGGADLDVDINDVRLIRAPTVAQILTVGSLQGIADTLNGEGVMFTRVVAPVQVRGSKITIGDARATGPALGLTTKGVADLKADTLDFEGTIAPAYSINSAVGAVPVLGQLLVSRQGEGVVGLGYAARGSFGKPQVTVNPLSLVTPGILRRLFETPAPANRPKRTATRGSR
ncbi:DUF3971 domain-containing protein [Caulobacter sp. 17J80-11]|uniref:YhdP family protein n=1 Tax=Caulobacter sp. 17J80-11 TaxID=2763502 RepID=UPI001653E793|nr:DUF3971 domain-containing protein [Caulobacter sp. 17J80-11]MBC6983248.1 hypothetical protein [Caulobacter sp. 17J80-11]